MGGDSGAEEGVARRGNQLPWRRWLARRRATDLIYRAGVAVVGTGIVALGLVAVPLPGPGWLTVFAGLAVLASEFRWAERQLDLTRSHVSRAAAWWDDRSRGVAIALVSAATLLVCGAFLATLQIFGAPEWMPAWVPG